MDKSEPLTAAMLEGPVAFPTEVTGERRRPERLDRISPELISLLRDPANADFSELRAQLLVEHPQEGDDDLNGFRGIFFGLALSVPLWAIAGAALWLALL